MFVQAAAEDETLMNESSSSDDDDKSHDEDGYPTVPDYAGTRTRSGNPHGNKGKRHSPQNETSMATSTSDGLLGQKMWGLEFRCTENDCNQHLVYE